MSLLHPSSDAPGTKIDFSHAIAQKQRQDGDVQTRVRERSTVVFNLTVGITLDTLLLLLLLLFCHR